MITSCTCCARGDWFKTSVNLNLSLGVFIRHSCGSFGESGGSLDLPIINYINHLFDCIEMGTSFRFENGDVTFYNRSAAFQILHLDKKNLSQMAIIHIELN